MNKKNIIYFLIFFFLILLVFKNWFYHSEIIGGDWPYFYSENIHAFNFIPPVWNSLQGNGMGGQSLSYALDTYLYFTGWFFSTILHLPWTIVYKIFWFGLFIFLAAYSIFKLQSKIFPSMQFPIKLVGSIIYTTNTYILMVVGGGQLGVALGYAIVPLVLLQFIRLIDNLVTGGKKTDILRMSLFAGLYLALQVMFDIRMVYLTVLIICCYILFIIKDILALQNKAKILSLILYFLIIPAAITILLHAFWLLPFLFVSKASVSQLGSSYTSVDSVKFFSFANFENAFGLLHPNWPENIFGKVGFMKAEFLLLPLIGFTSLLFISQIKKTKKILFFALIGLFGIFFAKGANDPFGQLYLWCFSHIPGFVMFRDPTKFYLLIALSYAIIIPLSIWSFEEAIRRFKYLSKVIVICFILFWFILIRQALLGGLGGTFQQHTIPNDYVKLKNILLENSEFSRVLWMPKMQRFGYASQDHPAIEAATVFGATDSAHMIKFFQEKYTETKLRDLSVQYVIVPFDSESEIFLKDRKYNDQERKSIIHQLQTIPWLKRDVSFTQLAVYSIQNHKGKFGTPAQASVSYIKKSDTTYILHINSHSATKLIMTEAYSPYWKAEVDNITLESKNFDNMNSFDLQKTNKLSIITVHYSLEAFYIIGRYISLLIAIIIITLCLIIHRRSK